MQQLHITILYLGLFELEMTNPNATGFPVRVH